MIEEALNSTEIFFELDEEEEKETLVRTFWIGPGDVEHIKDITPITPGIAQLRETI